MAGYRDRVLHDLPQWQRAGWVTAEGAAAIASSLPERRFSIGFSGIIAILGAILVGAGLVAFVAANWAAFPRLGRLGLVASIMIALVSMGLIRLLMG